MEEKPARHVAGEHGGLPLAGIGRRRFLAGSAGLVGLVGFGAVGCGTGSSGSGGGSKQIAFAQPDTNAALYPLLISLAKSEAKKRGYELLQSHASGQLDKQISELNTWIGQGVKGILVLPLDNNAMNPIIKRAHQNGVKILDYSDKALPGVDGWLIFDNPQGAKLVGDNAGQWVNKTLNGQAKVALLTHNIQQTGRDRINGGVAALKQVAPNVQIVAQHEGVLAADTLPVVQSMLQAQPDLNVILCIADDGCLGAEKAFMQTNPSQQRMDQMYIAGWDGSIAALQRILAKSVIRATGVLGLKNILAGIDATINAVEGKQPTKVNFPYVLASQDDLSQVKTLLKSFQAVPVGG